MKRRHKTLWVTGIAAVSIATTIAVTSHIASADAKESRLKQEMNLATLPDRNAPDFTLTDEHGTKVHLADLKGKVVVLEFMDPKCTDVCPIISAELVDAAHSLGSENSKVVYIGVNVNTYHRTNADLAKFSHQHGLSKLPNWYFVSGDPEQLARVWMAYGVYVKQNPGGDVIHSDYMYFIDASGKERFIAAASSSSTASISEWGQGIAHFAQKLM